VGFEMLGQLLDALAEESNLHFRRTGVRVVQTILGNYVFFDVRVLRHVLTFFDSRLFSRRGDTIRAAFSWSTLVTELGVTGGHPAALSWIG